jgi:hypothetical protein
MGTMTKRQACRLRRDAAAFAGARRVHPTHGAPVFARDMVWVPSPSDGTAGIGGTSETGRAFPAGDDM